MRKLQKDGWDIQGFSQARSLPSRQVKMEVQKNDHGHAPAFQLCSGLPHGPKWRTEVAVSVLTILSDLLSFKSVTTCFIWIYVDVVKKRPPQKGQKRRNDIYVNRKTDFAAQLERCQKSLDSRFVIFTTMLSCFLDNLKLVYSRERKIDQFNIQISHILQLCEIWPGLCM